MVATLLILNLFYLVSILTSSGGNGVKIRAYPHTNFKGLVWESNSSAACYNIPKDKIDWVDSITTDTCFIAYWRPNCKSGWSQKLMPGDTVLSSENFGSIESFQVCNEEEGGSQLNLDIDKVYEYAHRGPDQVESYKNVCSCVNVPQHVQNMSMWSINNHHNALLVYYEPNCSENKWNSTFIPAGHNHYTDMNRHKKTDNVTKTTYKIQSLGPDPNSTYFKTSCMTSRVTSTESSKRFERTTESEINVDSGIENRFQVLTNQIAELQVNQSDIRKEQTAYFANITQSFTELKKSFAKLKSGLHDLFAQINGTHWMSTKFIHSSPQF